MKTIKTITWMGIIILWIAFIALIFIPTLTLDKTMYNLNWIGFWMLIEHSILAIIIIIVIENRINKIFDNLKEKDEETNS